MARKRKIEENLISKQIPQLGLNLAKYSGRQLVERVGDDIIKNVVTSILIGGNVRSLTEGLTQRRVSLSNASMLIAYLKASKNIPDFSKNLTKIVNKELTTAKLTVQQKVFLQWFIGLTGKSIQNVLRSDKGQLVTYLSDIDNTLRNSIKQSKAEFGELSGSITIAKENYLINWPSILQLFLAIGAQTIAIRGSEKSMYGKLFEKLILGSVLTLLGFEMIDPTTSKKSKKVFWLSQREDKRESDATLLLKPGTGVRFDIGFIGPGNTEISLDKVSRFEREMEHGRQHHYMSTIILVDRIGEGSRITNLAKNIEGNIIQMSMTYWVKEICEILNKTTNFKHPILKMDNEKSIGYIKDRMKKINLNNFV
ncbi:MAG: hypothetical protein B6D64_09980 [Bacteroidetes bacterium 4484_276]|nr:MAG: hypothetical protein B6D64_09980 [Bacteroidetes bacterium 4484_276]